VISRPASLENSAPYLAKRSLVSIVFPQQFSQYQQLSACLRLKLQTQDCTIFGFRANPGHTYCQNERLPKEGGRQRKASEGALRERIAAAYLRPPHAQVHKQARYHLLGFLTRYLSRQRHLVTQIGTKMVKSWHADRLPHVERHKGALPW
jgi:hypothetical protein